MIICGQSGIRQPTSLGYMTVQQTLMKLSEISTALSVVSAFHQANARPTLVFRIDLHIPSHPAPNLIMPCTEQDFYGSAIRGVIPQDWIDARQAAQHGTPAKPNN
jgi:hypothetical protein